MVAMVAPALTALIHALIAPHVVTFADALGWAILAAMSAAAVMPSVDGERRQRGGTAFTRLYGTARWQRTRARQLATHPLCWRCQARGMVVEATVCNHTHGHPRGETEDQFWSGPFDSQCATCHSGETAREERGRPIVGCDAAGWPTP